MEDQARPNEVLNAHAEALRTYHLRQIFRQSRAAVVSSGAKARTDNEVRPPLAPQIRSTWNNPMYEEIPLDVSAGYPPIIYPLAAQNGQFSKYPAPGQATGMASAGGHCRHSRSILCAPSIVRQRVVGDNTYSTGIVGVSDWRSRGNGDPGSDKWNGISSNGEGRGSGTRVRAMPVAKLRQQWQEQQEQQRQGRLPSRMEHQQLPAGRLQQQQQPVAGAGWHEESRGSRWYEEVCTVVRSTDGPSMGMAIADVTCTSASPMTLYGYAERGASSSPSRYPGFSLPKRDQSGTVTYMATFWGDASEGGATAPRRQSPSIADVASTTAAAVAAAAANISTLLATASSALGKRPISTGRGHRNHIPPPQQRKPIYAPDLGPAFESRMPIFRNVTNMRQVDRKGSRQPAAIAVAGALGPCTSGTCTVNPPFLLSGHGNFRDLDGAGAGHITDGAADGDPDCRSRISAHLPEQTRPSAERKSSAVNRKSSNDVCRGPLVYDMLNQVDMHMPDMRSQRPRSAAAVMGRSKRGLDEAPQTLDARPALDVRETLLRKRAPSVSFAAPVYGTRSGSPRAFSRCDRDKVTEVEVDLGARGQQGLGAFGSRPRCIGISQNISARDNLLYGALGSPLRRMDCPAPAVGGLEGQPAKRDGIRSRGASRRRWAGGGKGPDGDDDGETDEAHERGRPAAQATAEPIRSAPATVFSRAQRFLREETNETEPSAGCTWQGDGTEGIKGHADRAGKGQRRRTRVEAVLLGRGGSGDNSNAADFATDGAKGGRGKAAFAAPASMAPLQLDVAYRAVLPRVTSAVISATSRHLDWLPSQATAGATQQLQQTWSTTRRRSASRPRDAAKVLGADQASGDHMNDDGTARKSLATSDADRSRSAPPEIRDSRGLRRWRGTTRGRVGATGWDIDGNTSGSGKPEAMGVLSGDEKRSTHDGRLLRQHGDATASRHASTSGSGPAEDIEDTGGGARGSMIDACNNGEGDISKGGPVAASAGGGLQSRCSRNRCEQNPIAAPKDLVEAMAFVRPRVQAVRFAYRSVAEDMRREVKQRRERQLRKAQELQEQLRNQTVEELWPATAAQIRRRERLQALSRRPRDLNADHSRQSSSDGLLLSLQSPPQGGEQMLQMHRQDAAPMNPPIRPWQPGHDEQRAVGSLASAQATTIAEMAIRAELDVAALATSSVPAGGGSPVRPTSPITNHQAAATMQPETAPFHDFPADESPSLEATGQREVVLAGPQRVPRIGRALSPERLPHFMAGTHLTLCNLVSPTSTAVAVKALAAAPTSPVPTDARPGEPHQQVLPRQASYALVEKRAPAVSFSPIRQGQQPQPRYSREPGPGHYDPDVADGTLSRLTRSPATVFGTARRDLNSSPTRHGCGSGTVAVAADIAWLDRDPATALDFTRRRVPTALILPEAAATTAPPSAGGDEGTGQSMLLDVRFTLVEPRVRGTPAMRKPQPPVVQVSDEDGELLERITGPTDPWAIDLATRPRRPAWGFPLLGHAGLIQSPVSRHLLDLRPVYGLVHRRVAGAPDFARTLERNAGDAERLRRLRRQPGIGEYDMEMAWSYLCRRAPQILMRLAAPRWREEDRVQGDSDGAVEVRQQQQALLELSQALDYIRPQPPAWTFAPVVRVVRHDPADPRVRGVGFGPLLSWDVNLVLVRRRLPGALPFDVGGPRRATLLDSRVLEAVRHLAPGYYEAEQAWRTAQPRPRVADFSRGFGRVADTDAPPSPDEKADLPHGTRLSLDAVAAKDATLPRRDRGAPAPMALALGRSKALPADPAYDGRTTHLPLPNPDLDLPIRPRVRNVVLEGTPGHRPLAPELSPTDALRGPGAYFPADADQALAALGPAARMVDFGRGPERDTLLGRDRLNATEVLEGNRLVLSPHMALDFVRTRPRAALIQPPHPYSAGASQDLPYLHALYDVDPGLGLLLRRAPGQLEFGTRPGRDLPLAWPAGIDPADPPYSRAVAWLGVDDVPLTQLAGFRRAPGAPDFARTRPRTPQEKGDSKEQRLLDLDPDAARDRLRRQPRRPPNLALGGGHVDPTGAGPDRHLTAWLSYRPRLDAIRRHLVPPLDVPMACQIDRDQALKADPRVGDNATGDLDGGVYRVRYRLVQRSAPVIDFGHDTGAGMRTGLAPGAVPVDLDAGNVLLLEPRLPTGWRPPLHSAGSPTRQPFGRGEGRWERPGADPAYRFLSAVGDEGPALYLRYSADNLALLRRRATAANTPAAAWGWMTSRRDAQVMQPDPARAPRPRLPSPATSRVATQLLQQLRPPSSELELLKNNLANDPRVVAIRRRDRVLQRMLDKIKAQRAALADI